MIILAIDALDLNLVNEFECTSLMQKEYGKTDSGHDQDFMINYVGPPGTINTVSYYQALERKKFLPENTFKDKLVFVGSTSNVSSDPNRPDHFLTPFSRFMLCADAISAFFRSPSPGACERFGVRPFISLGAVWRGSLPSFLEVSHLVRL